MSLSGYITVEAEVPVCGLVDHLSDHDIVELYEGLDFGGGGIGDPTHKQLVYRVAVAIERGDGRAAKDALHQLCMDMVGLPVLSDIEVIGWRGRVA